MPDARDGEAGKDDEALLSLHAKRRVYYKKSGMRTFHKCRKAGPKPPPVNELALRLYIARQAKKG